MGGSQNFGTDLEFARKRKMFGDPVLKLLLYPRKDDIPKLKSRSLEGERYTQKAKKLAMLNPLPLITLKPLGSWKKILYVTESLMPLNGGPRSKTKGVETLQDISNVFLILNESEKIIINKVTIHKLLGGVRKGNTTNVTQGNGISK